MSEYVESKVTKANALIKASYRFSLTEMQITLYGLSLVDPFKNDFPIEYVINVKKFAEKFNRDHKNIYFDLKQAVINKFWERDIRYELENGTIRKDRWLIRCEYNDKKGILSITFNPLLKPYLHQIANNFTVYVVDNISNFKSIYSIRLYEFFIMEINKSRNNQYDFNLSINEIKYRLQLEYKYPRYCDFKTRILNKAKSEINAHSDLIIDFEEIKKKGRMVESIKFVVKRKDGTQPARYQRIEENREEVVTFKPVLPSAEEMAQDMSKESIKERLINFGVTEKVAKNIVNEHSIGFIEKHIDYTMNKMKQGSVTNSAAFLVDSINHGYAT